MNLLEQPIEILIYIFKLSNEPKLTSLCKSIYQIFKNDKYNVSYDINYYYANRIIISKIPINILNQLCKNEYKFYKLLDKQKIKFQLNSEKKKENLF